MSVLPSIRDALARLGYRRRKRLVFRADWSTPEVEHFIYLNLYGAPKEFLAIDFGIRNDQAQRFGIEEIQKYGGRPYSAMKLDRENDCSMIFSFGLLSHWSPRWSLYLPSLTETELAAKIETDIECLLLPKIRGLKSNGDLLRMLISDVAPFCWKFSNGAIRAAQIANLGRQVGMDSKAIRSALQQFQKHIDSALPKDRTNASSSYLDNIVEDSRIQFN
jgi:hypothetical protein